MADVFVDCGRDVVLPRGLFRDRCTSFIRRDLNRLKEMNWRLSWIPNKKVEDHVVITGWGRCGTGILSKILARYLDKGTWRGQEHENKKEVRIGFEDPCMLIEGPEDFDKLPELVKDPFLMMNFPVLLEAGLSPSKIRHVFLCHRDPDQTTLALIKSRFALPGPPHLMSQDRIFAGFGYVVSMLETYEIPYSIIHHPRSVFDSDYLYEKLKPVLGRGLTAADSGGADSCGARDEFQRHFDDIVDPGRPTTYKALDYGDQGSVAGKVVLPDCGADPGGADPGGADPAGADPWGVGMMTERVRS